MKLYVSGQWFKKPQIQQIIEKLHKMGHSITRDWTLIEMGNTSNPAVGKYARLNANAIKNADILLVIMTDTEYPYRGTFTELGVALGCGTQIFIVCPFTEGYCRTNCYFNHPDIRHFETVDEALETIEILEESRKARELYESMKVLKTVIRS